MLRVTKEIDLRGFEPWSGGADRFKFLTVQELDELQTHLEEIYPDGIDETTVNDILWFEDEWYLDILGIDEDEFYKR